MNTEKGQSLVEFVIILAILAGIAFLIGLAYNTIFGGGAGLSSQWFDLLCATGGKWACR